MTIHDLLTKARDQISTGNTLEGVKNLQLAINEVETLSDYAADIFYSEVEDDHIDAFTNTVRMKLLPGDLT